MEVQISIHALRGEGDEIDKEYFDKQEISIHALRGEGDGAIEKLGWPLDNFYPRPPWGGRPTSQAGKPLLWTDFYPRPPWGGRQPYSAVTLSS